MGRWQRRVQSFYVRSSLWTVSLKQYSGLRVVGQVNFHHFEVFFSIFQMKCYSIRRYYAVLYPLRVNEARHRNKIMLALAWIYSTVCAAPQVSIQSNNYLSALIRRVHTYEFPSNWRTIKIDLAINYNKRFFNSGMSFLQKNVPS